ncbi:MAG: putative RNA polymerase II-associated protein 3 [Streblomastix strix]|uniref:RNA polymerase II-associated protein 3 n=1 Tax=Streblomastix strix TaxID=222440 RepID=A0A5J4W446_9EUKA|nr:MAG: putative RNA polymerase II-associated protein 3 [Streblomastix strix]
MDKSLVDIQTQIRRNAEETREVFKGLSEWEAEMNRQDEEVKKSSDFDLESLPPIRKPDNKANSNKKEPSKPSTQNEEPKNKGDKLKSSDYDKWDKLDVDKIAREKRQKELDEKEAKQGKKKSGAQNQTSQQQQSTSNQNTRKEGKQQIQELSEEEAHEYEANEIKEKGNTHFKRNELNEALECYSKAISLQPKNAIYLANRAACYLKMNRLRDAETDCTLSVSLDPNYTKAWVRRSTIRKEMGKFSQARDDLLRAQRIEPENKVIEEDLKQAEQLVARAASGAKMQIQAKDSEKEKKKEKEQEEELFRQIEKEKIEFEKKKVIKQEEDKKKKEEERKETETEQEKPKKRKMNIVEFASTEEDDKKKEQEKEQEQEVVITDKKEGLKDKPTDKTKPTTQTPVSVNPSIPQIPNKPVGTWAEFERMWRSLRKYPSILSEAMFSIRPQELTKMFGTNINSEHISSFVGMMRLAQNVSSIQQQQQQQQQSAEQFPVVSSFMKEDGSGLEKAAEFWSELAKVQRFRIAMKTLSKAQKNELNELLSEIKQRLPETAEKLRVYEEYLGVKQ